MSGQKEFQPSPQFMERMKLYEDTVACRRTDRVLAAPLIMYLPIFLYGGTTIRDVMTPGISAGSGMGASDCVPGACPGGTGLSVPEMARQTDRGSKRGLSGSGQRRRLYVCG